MHQLQPKWIAFITVMVLFAIYAFFPTINSTLDGFGYAAEIKKGYNLLRPHHLLYNAWGYCINMVAPKTDGFDLLRFLKFQNALFAALALWVLWLMMVRLGIDSKRATVWLFLVGSSYAVMRYATENETYMIPISLSLISSILYIKGWQTNKWSSIAASGFFAGMACLFHQIQIFWLLTLLVSLIWHQNKRLVLAFLAPTVVVPLAYAASLVFYEQQALTINNLLYYVTHDYSTGGAKTTINWTNFVLTPVSFVRTFVQVHGMIPLLLKQSAWFYASLLIPLAFLISLFWVKQPIVRNEPSPASKLLFIHAIIFAFQLGFAAFSHGNAEFMVMLPFLLPLLIERWWQVNTKAIVRLAAAMMIWNMGFALLPSAWFRYYDNARMVQFFKEHPNDFFIVADHNIVNEYEYIWGDTIIHQFILPPYDEWLKKHPAASLANIYTDVVNRPKPMSRGSILESHSIDQHFKICEQVLELNGFLGSYSLYRIAPKELEAP
jgi:hypothetical protein